MKRELVKGALNFAIRAFLAEEHILSKDEEGVYGLEKLSGDFHPLIRQALEIY